MFLLTPFNKKNGNSVYDLENMIDDFFKDSIFGGTPFYKDSMKIDVRETEKEFLIEADLPGIRKEDVNLELNEGKLIILVNQVDQKNDEQKNYIYRERRMSSMRREIYLKDVNREGILAKLDNGVLQIIVPKLVQPNNRLKIEIK